MREEKLVCCDKPQNCIETLRKIKRMKTRWLFCENRHFILMRKEWAEVSKEPHCRPELPGPVCSRSFRACSKVSVEAIRFTNLPLVLLNKKACHMIWGCAVGVLDLRGRQSVNLLNGSVFKSKRD
jgi:hypothetical protein